MAMFPTAAVEAANPLPCPTRTSENDKRRLRAYIVYMLEKKAHLGHTLYPMLSLINEINDQPLERPLHLTSDVVTNLREYLSFEAVMFPCIDGNMAMQLTRLKRMDDVIRSSVERRLGGARHNVDADWKKIVDDYFDAHDGVTTPTANSEAEKLARQEKVRVLEELSASRLSVLIGGAGSGKTTVLSLLCSQEQIAQGGVLLLAPTGKARVRLAQTVHETNDSGIVADSSRLDTIFVQGSGARGRQKSLDDPDRWQP